MISIFHELTLFVIKYPHLVSFFGAFFSEELLIFLAILSGRRLISFSTVFIFGFFGLVCIDSFFYIIGKLKISKYLIKKLTGSREDFEKKINSIDKKKSLLYLFLSKFVYGTRIASILYYSAKGISYRRFFAYDFFAVFVWSIIMLPIGYLAGQGFDKLLKLTRGIERFLAIILITVIIVYLINKLAKKVASKETFIYNKIHHEKIRVP